MSDKFEMRLDKLQQYIKQQELDLVIIFRRAEIYFLADTSQDGVLCIERDALPQLFLRNGFERAKNESVLPVKEIKSYSDLKNYLSAPSSIGFEEMAPTGLFWRFQKLFPNANFQNITPILRELRALKAPDEIAMIKEAGRLTDLGINVAKEQIKPGISELELVAEIEYAMRKEGHQEAIQFHNFNSILTQHVISGLNAAIPSEGATPLMGKGLSPSFPFGVSRKKIQKDEPLVVDIVGKYQGWLADQTRTIWFGKLSNKLYDAHLACQEILKAIVDAAQIGITAEELYNLGLAKAREYGYESEFMGNAPFIGHGLGLEIDEFPILAKKQTIVLQEGMVIAIEPKIVFKDIGAVGIENTYAMENGKLIEVTNAPIQSQ
ncbi:MAG: M24 family metallopeptidase [Candidatus Hermodarchaeota archaeon]